MVAGAVLSDLETNANFEIGAPVVERISAEDCALAFSAGSPSICRFEFPGGALVLFFAFEEPE